MNDLNVERKGIIREIVTGDQAIVEETTTGGMASIGDLTRRKITHKVMI